MTEITALTYGQRVARAREARGMTQEQLAVAAGCTAKTVRAIERNHGHRPQKRVAEGLAAVLGIAPEPVE